MIGPGSPVRHRMHPPSHGMGRIISSVSLSGRQMAVASGQDRSAQSAHSIMIGPRSPVPHRMHPPSHGMGRIISSVSLLGGQMAVASGQDRSTQAAYSITTGRYWPGRRHPLLQSPSVLSVTSYMFSSGKPTAQSRNGRPGNSFLRKDTPCAALHPQREN